MATLFSIGHSNQPLENFLALLAAHEVRTVVDVRAFPASRRWPHFNQAALTTALAQHGIRYVWLPALGGRRKAVRADSPHTAWTVPAFRHYADHTETAEFAAGLRELLALTAEGRTAFMCAEARYTQCHRRLIADQLCVAGHSVRHIESRTRAQEHALSAFARVVDGRIIYDGGTQLGLLGEKR
jgi:uncharacterized protein (DUF488 family)